MSDPLPHSSVSDLTRLNDRDLLRRFVQDRDEHAFAEIVRRYQGLVRSVCLRVTGNEPDADDAFQATFIALAGRPRQIRRAAVLSSWLYTVAWRTGWRLVRQRRRNAVDSLSDDTHEEPESPLDRIAAAQDCVVLDEELNALPDRYREVLVMTYFANQSSQQIADQLNVSKGTIDGRIRQARNRLRVRLARRGVALGAVTVAAGLSSARAASASSALIQSTVSLGAEALRGSLSLPADLSSLEPLFRPELTMMNAKPVMMSLICAVCAAGLAGLGGLALADGGPSGEASTVLETTAERGSVGTKADLTALVAQASSPADSSGDDVDFDVMIGVASSQATAKHKPYPADASPHEIWIHETLAKPCAQLDFPGETPLSEVLDQIVTHINSQAKNGAELAVLVDHVELQNEGLGGLDDVLVRDICLQGVSAQNVLDLVFEQAIDAELAYMIRNDVMVITTEHAATGDEELTTRVYDISHIVSLLPQMTSDYDYGGMEGMDYSSMGGGGYFAGGGSEVEYGSDYGAAAGESGEGEGGYGMEDPVKKFPRLPARAVAELERVVMEMTSPPCRWVLAGGEGGSVKLLGKTLVVRQTPSGHREVARLLNLLEMQKSSNR